MLYVYHSIGSMKAAKLHFYEANKEKTFIDLSTRPSWTLAEESESIVEHHSGVSVFLGYLEPGWMIEPAHQTRMRHLIRKFPVGIVCEFVESLPHSWKTDIDTFYTEVPLNKNGHSDSLNDGSALQYESKV
jgi:hypothetical protein